MRLVALTLLLAASTASGALAQALPLRGELSENAINRQILPRARTDAAPQAGQTNPTQDAYVPSSPGAVPDEPEPTSLFPLETTLQDEDETVVRTPPVRVRARPEPETAEDTEVPAPAAAEDIDETPTATTRQERLDALDEEANGRLEADNARAEAIEGRDAQAETDPYAPLGIRIGTFDVNAEFDQGLRATTNVDSSPGGGSAVLSETQLRLNAFSDWSRHSATVSAYGIVRKTISGDEFSEVEGGADAVFNADLANGFTGRAALGYSVRPESATSPVVIVNSQNRPLRHNFDGELALRKEVGKARLGISGAVDRSIYEDADIVGGGTVSQEERNSTLATVTLRAGYAISPALAPFVETEIGRRFYDVKVDSSGYERSANRLALRAGAEIDLGEKLSGEFSAGWLRESFDDSRLLAASGVDLDARLDWSPERDTTVSLLAGSEVEGTTTAGESGSVRYTGDIRVTRKVRSNLTVGASGGIAWRDYIGSPDHEMTLVAEATATWWLSRYVGINSRLRHESFRSTLPGRDSETSSVYLGLRLQR